VTDAALEASVVGSFSRVGFAVRRRCEHWGPPSDLTGRVVIVTGASSGIGRAAALELARLGASVWLVGRNKRRTEEAALAARSCGAGAGVEPAVLDIVDAEAVDAFAAQVAGRHKRLHGLIHAAGALFPTYRMAPDGGELTVATAVLAPFRLTWLLSPLLSRSGDANIVTLSSGGMYTQPFDLARLETPPEEYRGTTAYARAKRAQVVLSHEWARRWNGDGVASYAAHPGWVDTPGLASGLPSFAKLGPLLRTPAQGADTVVWLAAGEAGRRDLPDPLMEGFFHDRHRRSEYHLPGTRRGAGTTDGARLWEWCQFRTGLQGEPPAPSTRDDQE
jgi:NAD(P)-dependent dehydrogenase (short-subunit alcohol dehydrogenase family)